MLDLSVSPLVEQDPTQKRLSVRRARIGSGFAINSATSGKVVFDIDEDGTTALLDAYATYTPNGSDWALRLGRQKTPISIDFQTSSRSTAQFERSAYLRAFGVGRGDGASILYASNSHLVSFGLLSKIRSENPGLILFGRVGKNIVWNTEHNAFLGISARAADDQKDLLCRPTGTFCSMQDLTEPSYLLQAEYAGVFRSNWYTIELAQLSNARGASGHGGYIEFGRTFGGKRSLRDGRYLHPVSRAPESPNDVYSISARMDFLDHRRPALLGRQKAASAQLSMDWWPSSRARLGLSTTIEHLGRAPNCVDHNSCRTDQFTSKPGDETTYTVKLRLQTGF